MGSMLIQCRSSMILTVGHTQGGVGKTTLAVELAPDAAGLAGHDCLLVDADPQGRR